jgi:hypothetical protein
LAFTPWWSLMLAFTYGRLSCRPSLTAITPATSIGKMDYTRHLSCPTSSCRRQARCPSHICTGLSHHLRRMPRVSYSIYQFLSLSFLFKCTEPIED